MLLGWDGTGWDGMGWDSPRVSPPRGIPAGRGAAAPAVPRRPSSLISAYPHLNSPSSPPPGLGAYLPAAGSLYKTLIKCLAVTYPGREIAFSRTSRKSDPQEAGGAPPTASPAAHRDAGQGEGGTTRVPKARTCRLSPRHGPENP